MLDGIGCNGVLRMWIHRYIPKTKELLALEGIEGDCELLPFGTQLSSQQEDHAQSSQMVTK